MTKPPYRVPLMNAIRSTPWNGYNVVSTFSGCRGSCLGFRMEGFKIVWANEFIPAAAETYRANNPHTYLETRDIRQIKTVLAPKGGVDVMEGSPPCAAFSASGKKDKLWGQVRKYSDTHQRVDDLFGEYARMVKMVQPKVFVAENVSGLFFGKAAGYFQEIFHQLELCGYSVEARMLDAQHLGVPQARRRIIFMGIRKDLYDKGIRPRFPKPLPYRYSVSEALDGVSGASASDPVWLGPSVGRTWDQSIPARTGKKGRSNFNLVRAHADLPCPTVTATGKNRSAAGVAHWKERRKFTIAELKRICAFPDDFILTGSYSQQYERLGRSVPPLMMRAVAREVRGILDQISKTA